MKLSFDRSKNKYLNPLTPLNPLNFFSTFSQPLRPPLLLRDSQEKNRSRQPVSRHTSWYLFIEPDLLADEAVDTTVGLSINRIGTLFAPYGVVDTEDKQETSHAIIRPFNKGGGLYRINHAHRADRVLESGVSRRALRTVPGIQGAVGDDDRQPALFGSGELCMGHRRQEDGQEKEDMFHGTVFCQPTF